MLKVEVRYDHLALYHHPDYSQEWVPCKIGFKYQQEPNELERELSSHRHDIEGYGVYFIYHPEGIKLIDCDNQCESY